MKLKIVLKEFFIETVLKNTLIKLKKDAHTHLERVKLLLQTENLHQLTMTSELSSRTFL